MRVASVSTEVKCHNFLDGSLQSSYKSPSASNAQINTVSWGKDGGWVVIVPSSGSAEIVSINDSVKLLYAIHGVQHPRCAAFQNSTKRNVAVGTSTGQLLVYDIKQKTIRKRLGNAPSPLFKVQYACNDAHVVAACENGEVYVYNNNNNLLTGSFKVARSRTLTNFRCHPTRRNLIGACSEEGVVTVWDTHKSKPVGYVEAFNVPVTDLCFSTRDATLLACAGMDCRILLYDFYNKHMISDIDTARMATSLDYSPDGTGLAVGFQDGRVVSYDVRQLKEHVHKFSPHKSKVNQVAFERCLVDKPSNSLVLVDEVVAEPPDSPVVEPTKRRAPSDSFSHFCVAEPLPDIPEVEVESTSRASIRDSFLDAVGLHGSPAPLVHTSTTTLVTSEPDDAEERVKSHVDNFVRTQLASTPLNGGGNKSKTQDALFLSPILVDGRLPNEVQLKQLVRDAVRDELREFKDELKLQMWENMRETRRHFLDLQMSLVKEFIRVEDHLNKFREELSTAVDENWNAPG